MLKLFILGVVFAVIGADYLDSSIFKQDISVSVARRGDVPIGIAPYHVTLHINYPKVFHCAGVIISQQWVITSWTYVSSVSPEQLFVRAGSIHYDRDGTLHRVDKTVFPDASSDENYYALSLLRVIDLFHFDQTRQPISMFHVNEVSLPGTPAILTGYGGDHQDRSDVLQTLELFVYQKQQCELFVSDMHNKICAADPYYGACAWSADSGGPLIIDGRLAGILTLAGYGEPGSPERPSIFSEISAHRSWIKNVTGI